MLFRLQLHLPPPTDRHLSRSCIELRLRHSFQIHLQLLPKTPEINLSSSVLPLLLMARKLLMTPRSVKSIKKSKTMRKGKKNTSVNSNLPRRNLRNSRRQSSFTSKDKEIRLEQTLPPSVRLLLAPLSRV